MENLEIMRAEWVAWRAACDELLKLGVAINDEPALAAWLVCWGERLVALRLDQPQHVEPARVDAEASAAKYPQAQAQD